MTVLIISDPRGKVVLLSPGPIHLTRGDVGDVIHVRGKNADGSGIATVVGTVVFRMVRRGDGHTVAGAGAIVGANSDEFTYTTVAGDTDHPGCYDARFVVTYSGGEVRSFPGAGVAPDGLVVVVS